MQDLLMSFYGDDFTGSTDAMECLELNGIPAVLYLDPPTPEQVAAQFPEVRGVGVAGVSRTMSPAQMDEELTPTFEKLKRLNAAFFHYKICSTFDSSPEIGSIGRAIDIGSRVFESAAVPLVVGAPFLRRYVAFGNLFARVGETTYRLDRHPTMSRHPITPMTESDLRVHLSRQTGRRIESIDVWHMERSEDAAAERLHELIDDGAEIIVFDTLDTAHMKAIGKAAWGLKGERTAFLVGSSSIEFSLGMYLQSVGVIDPVTTPRDAGRADPIVVVSGSCSPGNDVQIERALDDGFAGLQLDAAGLVDPATADATRETAVQDTIDTLERGQSVVLYSARGPEDPVIAATNQRLGQLGLDSKSIGWRLGAQQGLLLREILERTELKRACVAGGDTCGHAAKQLGLYALRMVIPVAPGAPLCRAYSEDARFNGLELSLKGGQNGAADYFVQIRNGKA
jgi:3-oxoisoapionate kinase